MLLQSSHTMRLFTHYETYLGSYRCYHRHIRTLSCVSIKCGNQLNILTATNSKWRRVCLFPPTVAQRSLSPKLSSAQGETTVCVCVCVCVCMCVCMHVYVCVCWCALFVCVSERNRESMCVCVSACVCRWHVSLGSWPNVSSLCAPPPLSPPLKSVFIYVFKN